MLFLSHIQHTYYHGDIISDVNLDHLAIVVLVRLLLTLLPLPFHILFSERKEHLLEQCQPLICLHPYSFGVYRINTVA